MLERTPIEPEEGAQSVTVRFTLQERTADVEFRGVTGTGDGTVRFHGVTVERIDDSS